MRNIKFRKWHKELSDMTFWDGIKEKNNLFWHTLTEYPDMYVLMQFTGLSDKNGKEVYEGDIILFQKFSNWDDDEMKRHTAKVIFKDGCFMWEIAKEGKTSNFHRAFKTEPLKNTNTTWGLEIIGNIYENPELLKSL